MSQIFDALQRSEAEASGAGSQALLEATELLRRAERRAATQSDAESGVEPHEVTDPRSEIRFAEREAELVGALNSISNAAALQPEAARDPFSRFPSFLVPESATAQLICLSSTNSLAAEAFRLLSVRLRHLRRERTLGTLLVTSTLPQEGKSTVAANLACTLTARQKTLLLEGDVRRPSLSKLFGLEQKVGLCEWLRGDCNAWQCTYHLEGPGFWMIPAGKAGANPLELLQSGRLPALMEQLGGWFEWIVIDSPPVLPLADTSVWTRIADGILLVARQGTTRKKQLKKGLEAIESRKLIGALVNSATGMTGDGYYYSTAVQSKNGSSE